MFTALQKKAIAIVIFCLWNVSNLHAMEQHQGYEMLAITNVSSFHAAEQFYTHLQRACLDGNEEKVAQGIQQIYWDNKTTVTTYDHTDFKKIPTCLHLATQGGHVRIIEKLLKAKADINSTHCDYDATPLHTAVWCEKPNCVETLMQHGANPLIPNCDGNTPVHLAAFTGNLPCLEKLLKPGNIPLNFVLCATKNKKGQTPLDLAIMTESTNASQKLQKTMLEIIFVYAYLGLVSEYARLLEQFII